jgi:hypothetical protein
MPLSVAELQPVLHDLFNGTASDFARESKFCRRARKLTGPVFAQSLVFTLLENPNATLEDFADTACEELDVSVSPQAFDKRFTAQATEFLRDLFLEGFNRSFNSLQPALLPLLRRFNGVFLRDATLLTLPGSLAWLFPGRGGLHAPDGQAAAVKLVFEAEVTTGQFTEVSILPGLANEKTSEVAGKPLPAGALLLEDMGFLSGERLQGYMEQGVYVLTRVPAWTAFFDEKGKRLDLVKELRKAQGWRYQRQVQIMHEHKLPMRLLAVRLPEAEAQKRREEVIKDAKKRGRPVSQKKLELCEWNILLTNAPKEMLGAEEACVLRRVRWQIELVFKVFKSEGKVDETRSKCPYRVLCELYAKLLAMLVQQWALLAAGYVMLRHSARRAARRVRKKAMKLLGAIGRLAKFARVVARLAEALHRRCKVTHRNTTPSTLDRLTAFDRDFDQPRQVA